MASSPRSQVDLERELTCSICTEVLFQPLTLLDCLHTFCGSCLKDWFGWQQIAAESSASSRAPAVFTCPACRARVRDTRHNATVTTLLDMFLAANPHKAKPDDEKEEMRQKYRPGDDVLPRVRAAAAAAAAAAADTSPEEARLEQLDRQMLEQARELSRRDVAAADSRSADGSREQRHRDERDRTRRDEERRRRAESGGMLQPESSRRSESRARSRDSSYARRRHIEHQASIRSLISSSDVDSRDLEQEIDDFARQIQEEGLLDGLDLQNIHLDRNDELSRKITEAYRRRQRDRHLAEPARRSNGHLSSHRSEASYSHSRPPMTDPSRPSSRRRSGSGHVRPLSSSSQADERSRPPSTPTHLEVRRDAERHRRRASSGGRSSTEPTRTDLTLRSQSSEPPTRRPSLVEGRSTSMPIANAERPSPVEQPSSRDLSFSERALAAQAQSHSQSPAAPPPLDIRPANSSRERARRTARPSSLVTPQSPLPSMGLISSPTHGSHHYRTRSYFYQEPSITCSRCQKPHIEYELHYNCSRCAGGNWNICLSCYRSGKGCLHWFGFGYAALPKWERERERARAAGSGSGDSAEQLERPHMLTSNRYVPPRFTPGGAEGRKTLTTDNPANRLESGLFCARCLAWANECFWRCGVCNEGDWGFCNACVNQGCACTHPLLPLAYVAPAPAPSDHSPSSPPGTPGSRSSYHHAHQPQSRQQHHRRPRSASLFTGPGAASIGNFRPLVFTGTCDACRSPIPPQQKRFHCRACCASSTCTPSLPEAQQQQQQVGDYEICTSCYDGLVRTGRVSSDNGPRGWRRCPRAGHRMDVVAFTDDAAGPRRRVVRDVVGGRGLHVAEAQPQPQRQPQSQSQDNNNNKPQQQQDDGPGPGPLLQTWWWWQRHPVQPTGRGVRAERLVAVDVAASPPASASPPAVAAAAAAWSAGFPPDGGTGGRGVARWSWLPSSSSSAAAAADDELLLPRGAEVREVEDVNGDWFAGSYMGASGLFPAPGLDMDIKSRHYLVG
ncbi:hypothetical protein GGR56DRAFT_664106 [Xylariaceae sp. FL0804]|nr:hypothetical protein GGR56DRAFT_664106 [Xylariaceae sp. FL0804]